MPRLRTAAVGAALLAAGLVAALGSASSSVGPTDPSGPVLFADYFNSPQDANWTFYNRYGEIANGASWSIWNWKAVARTCWSSG